MAIPLIGISPVEANYYRSNETKLTKVQAFVRGWLLRRAIAPEKKLLNTITRLNEEQLAKYELAFNVFCFSEVVMKKRSDCRKDFLAHEQARSLCRKEQLDHLAIPECRVFNKFIIETRLPISPDLKELIGLYIENHSLFDTAVKQFITFYLHCKFDDIVGGSIHPYSCFLSNFPRYDNVSFFIENGIGKMGLIDLEKFELYNDWFNRNPDECFNQFIILFPFHFDLIIGELKILFPEFKFDIEKYRAVQRKVLDFFDAVYFRHKSFLMTKKIGLQNPKSCQIPRDEIDKIAADTGKTYQKVESVVRIINESISSIDPCQSWPELLSKRSPDFRFEDIDIQVLKNLEKRGFILSYVSYSSVCVHL